MWLFGYGSLLWKQGFQPLEVRDAHAHGFSRTFSQQSWDHRGTPAAPGRVANLIEADTSTFGRIFLLPSDVRDELLAQLDHREKAGYTRHEIHVETERGPLLATTFIGEPGNPDDARGEDPDTTARIIARAHGPSGSNVEYLFRLCEVLRAAGADDPLIFDLERRVRAYL